MSGQTVAEIGEFGLIAALQEALPAAVRSGADLLVGIGDDTAIWQPPADPLIVTTDSLVEQIHFRFDLTDWRSLGHKALAVNLSDIAAMGGRARLATITLGLRGDERVEDLRDLYGGLGALAERTGTLVAGGDTVASPQAVTVHVTAIGQAPGGAALLRSGARPGDLVAVSGALGASAAGLELLLLPANDPRVSASTADLLRTAHLRPEPRMALGQVLRQQGATSAMDLSDGLFGDLPKILNASRVSARIEASRIPVPAAIRALFPEIWFDLATRGGEDYELLFTAAPREMHAITRVASEIGATITVIGTIASASPQPLLTLAHEDGRVEVVDPGAFDHFRATESPPTMTEPLSSGPTTSSIPPEPGGPGWPADKPD